MHRIRTGIFFAALVVAAGCGEGDDDSGPGASAAAPLIEGPVTGGGAPLDQGTTFNLVDAGFVLPPDADLIIAAAENSDVGR